MCKLYKKIFKHIDGNHVNDIMKSENILLFINIEDSEDIPCKKINDNISADIFVYRQKDNKYLTCIKTTESLKEKFLKYVFE